ncbi:MAG: alpha-galactosidase [Clostridia bacterium]|nr:alpha-galactosidase [Clostridia bacterium]
MGYPAATMSCHVSNRNNICEDEKHLKFHGDVAMAGALGYEMNLPKTSDKMREGISEQIKTYRKYENAVYTDQNGKEYSGEELIRGIEFVCDETNHNSCILYFKKK